MRHDAHLIRTDTGDELIFPVPPERYDLTDSLDYATEYVQEVGEVRFPGLRLPSQITLTDLLIPKQQYPFASSAADDPHAFVDALRQAMHDHVIYRYIESGTTVNRRVFLTSVERSERDGTDDVYLTLTLQEYTDLDAPTVRPAIEGAALSARPDDFSRSTSNLYAVQEGDSWYRIASLWYRDPSLADALAAYNEANPELPPQPDTAVMLPPAASLSSGEVRYSADCGYTAELAEALQTLSGAVSKSDTVDPADPALYQQWLELRAQGLTPLSYPDWLAEVTAL